MFFIGLIDGNGNEKRLKETVKLLEFCQPVIITDNIYGALYTKLAINAANNGLGAISGLTIGEIASNSQTRHQFMNIVTELNSIADKLGIQLIMMGTFHPRDISLTGSDSPDAMKEKHRIIKDMFAPYKDVKVSTLQSLERGQRSEIEYLNGYIVKKGKELGISTPINAEITHIVKEIEAGRRKISPDNLLDLSIP